MVQCAYKGRQRLQRHLSSSMQEEGRRTSGGTVEGGRRNRQSFYGKLSTTRGDNNVSNVMKQRTDWVVWARTSSPKREASGHRVFETHGRGFLKHMEGFLWDKESKGRRRRRQAMKGREASTGVIHADGRDGGIEEMSKPSRVHDQCRAGFTRGERERSRQILMSSSE